MKFKKTIFVAFLCASSAGFLSPEKALASDCPAVDKATEAAAGVMATTWASMKAFFTVDTTAVPAVGQVQSNSAAKATAETTAASAWEQYILPLGKCAAYKAGQIALDTFTKQTVTWIQSGMHGSPFYVIDEQQFELDLLDSVAGNLMRQIQGAQLCDFNDLFKNDLANWVIMGEPEPAQRFRAQLKCPFPQMNASDFYSGVQAFSWKGLESALNDGGNPFTIRVATGNELTKTQKKTKERAQKSLDWNQGFLSVVDDTDLEKCNWPDQDTKDSVMGTGPEAIEVRNADGTTRYLQLDPLPEEHKKALIGQYCPKTTPGALISHQLTKATDIDWDRLGLQDDITKITNALITHYSQEIIKGVFKKK